jgi:hypothetical protein
MLRRTSTSSSKQIGTRRTYDRLQCLSDACIVEDVRGMRVDIFLGTICRKLHFSPGMIGRSERYGLLGNLELFICAREDIFLLKSVTERSRDLKDMAVLYAKGLNGQIIMDECAEQTLVDADGGGRIWETFLVTKMEELEVEVEITIPWMSEVKKVAEKRLIVSLITQAVAEGVTNVPAISMKLKLDQVTVRRTVARLEKEGCLSIDRTSRPHRILTKK